jgi:hypothetical protein
MSEIIKKRTGNYDLGAEGGGKLHFCQECVRDVGMLEAQSLMIVEQQLQLISIQNDTC